MTHGSSVSKHPGYQGHVIHRLRIWKIVPLVEPSTEGCIVSYTPLLHAGDDSIFHSAYASSPIFNPKNCGWRGTRAHCFCYELPVVLCSFRSYCTSTARCTFDRTSTLVCRTALHNCRDGCQSRSSGQDKFLVSGSQTCSTMQSSARRSLGLPGVSDAAARNGIPKSSVLRKISSSIKARRAPIAAHAAPAWPAIALRRARQVICRDAPFLAGNSPTAEDISVVESSTEQQLIPDFFSPPAFAAAARGASVPLAAAVAVQPTIATHGVVDLASTVDPDAANTHTVNKSGLNGLTVGATSGLITGNFTVSAKMPVLYTIQEVPGILEPKNKALLRGVVPGSFPFMLAPEPEVTTGLRRLVVIDNNVERIYGDSLRKYFEHHGVEYKLLILPTCEENKELHLVTTIAEAIEDFKINRRQEPIIAIGGGVCLDVTGLAANLYRRNTGIIKIPTTVMGVVDASIGIKTAVNFHEKKNKLGTYCPPLGVFYDTSFLATLDSRNISNGSAEIFKMSCIKDRQLFELMEQNAEQLISQKFQGPIGAAAIRRSIQGMLEELEYNLWEAILVRLVDYGHTVSPELEMAALRSPEMLLHGEAVTIDMGLSTELSYGRGLISAAERERILGVMVRLGLPLWHESCNIKLFMKGLEDMTRTRDGLQRVPLMKSIGSAVFVNDITEPEMAAAADRLLHYAAVHGSAAAIAAVANDLEQQAYAVNNVVSAPTGLLQAATKQPAEIIAGVCAE